MLKPINGDPHDPTPMAIYRLIANGSFEPEEIEGMTQLTGLR